MEGKKPGKETKKVRVCLLDLKAECGCSWASYKEAWSLEGEVKWDWGQGKSVKESAHHLPSSTWRWRSANQSTAEPRQRVARAVAGELLESGEAISCSGSTSELGGRRDAEPGE
jgi:hypothetical protein